MQITRQTVQITRQTVQITWQTVQITRQTVQITRHTANGADNTANSADNIANSADNTENSADNTANSADNMANSADNTANSADNMANSADNMANSADNTANSADNMANSADNTANSADSQGISASCPVDQQQNMLQQTTEYILKCAYFVVTINNRKLTHPTTECDKNRHFIVGHVSILLLIMKQNRHVLIKYSVVCRSILCCWSNGQLVLVPCETAPSVWSGSSLFAQTCLSKTYDNYDNYGSYIQGAITCHKFGLSPNLVKIQGIVIVVWRGKHDY